MTLLTKVLDRTKATWNDLLERIDGPELTIDDTFTKLEEEMDALERTAAAMIGTERELLSRLEDASLLSGELGLRATRAVEEGREFVAKQMLEEKQHYDEVIAEIRERYQEARCRVQELVEKLYVMKEHAFMLRKQREQLQN